MIQTIPPEITIASFSFIGVLTGYIWNGQNKKIDLISKVQNQRPCNVIHNKISQIQTDIDWIKKSIKK